MVREVLNLLPHTKPSVKEPNDYLALHTKAVTRHPCFALLHVTVDGDSFLLPIVTRNLSQFLHGEITVIWFNDCPHSVKGLHRNFVGGTSTLSFGEGWPLDPGLLWETGINERCFNLKDMTADFTPFVFAMPASVEKVARVDAPARLVLPVLLFQLALRSVQMVVLSSSTLDPTKQETLTENITGLWMSFLLMDSIRGWAAITRKIMRNSYVGAVFILGRVPRGARAMTIILEFLFGTLRSLGMSREFAMAVLVQLFARLRRKERALSILKRGGKADRGMGYQSTEDEVSEMMKESVGGGVKPLSPSEVLAQINWVNLVMKGLFQRLGIEPSPFIESFRDMNHFAEVFDIQQGLKAPTSTGSVGRGGGEEAQPAETSVGVLGGGDIPEDEDEGVSEWLLVSKLVEHFHDWEIKDQAWFVDESWKEVEEAVEEGKFPKTLAQGVDELGREGGGEEGSEESDVTPLTTLLSTIRNAVAKVSGKNFQEIAVGVGIAIVKAIKRTDRVLVKFGQSQKWRGESQSQKGRWISHYDESTGLLNPVGEVGAPPPGTVGLGVIFHDMGSADPTAYWMVLSCASQSKKGAVRKPIRFLKEGLRGRISALPMTRIVKERESPVYEISAFSVRAFDVPEGSWPIKKVAWMRM
uniref:Uncharacterized protein n=1 Tax=Chromera velia CCMP2878 TaxID=1169474 RepID=A0A0G4HZC9_9ALVE|eukprot:Cvel_9681.t1-p1 / transcript=Cvel_9681.t1 / gene=Cvel_9681 / organism=Chromera_velia_CCMP2878 / gene_product=hypothetical protein / transcript_product=hypothetical protein / location=Cvel_scaffold564:23438-25562(-) / protein_length=640 / sequence_SO=supercontig / SO=protein_coding / is_pseudo=false